MENDTRDRVRALVREVLAKAAPESAEEKPQPQPEPRSRFVNTVPESSAQSAVTRDESAPSVKLNCPSGIRTCPSAMSQQ